MQHLFMPKPAIYSGIALAALYVFLVSAEARAATENTAGISSGTKFYALDSAPTKSGKIYRTPKVNSGKFINYPVGRPNTERYEPGKNPSKRSSLAGTITEANASGVILSLFDQDPDATFAE